MILRSQQSSGNENMDPLNSRRLRWEGNIWFDLNVGQIRCENVAWCQFRMWSLVNRVIKPVVTCQLRVNSFL